MQTTDETDKGMLVLNNLSFWSNQGLKDTSDQYASQFDMIFGHYPLSVRLRATINLICIINQRLSQLHNGSVERLLLHNLRKALCHFHSLFVEIDESKANNEPYLNQLNQRHAQPIKNQDLKVLKPKPCLSNQRIRHAQLWTSEQRQAHRLTICLQTNSLVHFSVQKDQNNTALFVSHVTTTKDHQDKKLIISAEGDLFLLNTDTNELLLTDKRDILFCGLITLDCQGYPTSLTPLSDHYEMDDLDAHNALCYLESRGLKTKITTQNSEQVSHHDLLSVEETEVRRQSMPTHEFVYENSTEATSSSRRETSYPKRFPGLSNNRRARLKKNNSVMIDISPSTKSVNTLQPIRWVRGSYNIKEYIDFLNHLKMWCVSNIEHKTLSDELINLCEQVNKLAEISTPQACPEWFYKQFDLDIKNLISNLGLKGKELAGLEKELAKKPWRDVPEKRSRADETRSTFEGKTATNNQPTTLSNKPSTLDPF